jgi:hypothetical protein
MPLRVNAVKSRPVPPSVPETLTFRVSVPPPPEMLSPGLKVVPSVAPKVDPTILLKLSFPLPPEKLVPESVLVVSDLFCTQNGVNTHLFYLYFDIRPDIDSITTIDYQ